MKKVITISSILLLVLSVFTVADEIVSITPQTPNQFDSLSCLVGGRIRQGFSYEWIIGDNVFNQNPLALNGRFAGEEAICNVYVETLFESRIVGSSNVCKCFKTLPAASASYVPSSP